MTPGRYATSIGAMVEFCPKTISRSGVPLAFPLQLYHTTHMNQNTQVLLFSP